MKKYILSVGATAALLLGAASCSSEMEPAMTGDEVMVQYTVSLADNVESRTISDGMGANTLKFAVFTEDGQHIAALDQTVAVENKAATISTKLAKYHTYKLVFWAQNSACTAYDTSDMSAITVDYSAVDCNDETRDAFYKMEVQTMQNAEVSRQIVLTRPFAQINFLASDAAGVTGLNAYTSKVTVTGVPTTLNTLDGTVGSTTADVTFDYATILNETLAGYEAYKYVAMNYILAADEQELKNTVELTLNDGTQDVNTVTATSVPVQRNYRTNIIGDLFTVNGQFNIVIDEIYEGNLPEVVWDGITVTEPDVVDGAYAVGSPDELAYIFQNKTNLTNASTIVLTDDVNMGGLPFSTIGEWETPTGDITIDGQGHTIKGLTQALIPYFNTAHALEIKNLTIADSQIEGDLDCADNTHIGAFVGWIGENWTSVKFTNCHLLNSSVRGADQNGGIFGYATGSGKNLLVTDCSVENCEIWSKENCAPLCGNGAAGGGTLTVTNFVTRGNTVTSEKTGDASKLRAGSLIATINTGTVKIYNLTDENNNVTAGGNTMTTFYGRWVGGVIYVDDVQLTH